MAETDNIKIRQNWIEEETDALASELQVSNDYAFMLLGSSLLLSSPPDEIDPEDIVDGGQDKQIDFIHIEDDQQKGHAEVTIAQFKNTSGFSSNCVIQIRNGLDWIFERPKAEVISLTNERFKQRILEIRELRREYGPANIDLSIFHVTNGNKVELAD